MTEKTAVEKRERVDHLASVDIRSRSEPEDVARPKLHNKTLMVVLVSHLLGVMETVG
jgi:hypothetical protein